jgi:hypothetical protein
MYLSIFTLELFSVKTILFAVELVSFSWTMAPVNWSLTLCQRLLWLFDEHQKSEDLSLEVLYLLLLLLLQCRAAVVAAVAAAAAHNRVTSTKRFTNLKINITLFGL